MPLARNAHCCMLACLFRVNRCMRFLWYYLQLLKVNIQCTCADLHEAVWYRVTQQCRWWLCSATGTLHHVSHVCVCLCLNYLMSVVLKVHFIFNWEQNVWFKCHTNIAVCMQETSEILQLNRQLINHAQSTPIVESNCTALPCTWILIIIQYYWQNSGV